MPSYPLPTLGVTIDQSGISAPSFNDIYQSLVTSFQQIYGSDIYISPDSQDGQWLGVLAKGFDDSNKGCIATFNGYSPLYAQGAALSAAVKINGLQRLVSSNSSALVTLVGVANTPITNGVVADQSGNQWNLPASVTIPNSGTIDVTVTAQKPGAIAAGANTIDKIVTVQKGWQTVNNAAAAAPGAPVETDPALRSRQSVSVANPSQTVLEGALGDVKNLPGVTAARVYENDTGSTDANGIPAGNVAFVVQGGTALSIATTIFQKRTMGVPTYGGTSQVIVDNNGNSHTIHYSVAASQRILVAISLHGFANYTTLIGDQIKAAVAAYINALGIGNKIYLPRLYLPAQLFGGTGSETYELVSVQAAISPASPGSSDVSIAFNQIANCVVADITISTV